MIITFGSDKGSPGVTTLALLLATCWPGQRIVAELDPSGADLPYRVGTAGGQPLAASPTVTTLALDSRPGAERRPLLTYAQIAACGIPLLVGETSASRFARIVAHLPAIGGVFSASPEAVFADLGQLHPTNPMLPLARSAAATVLVTRADTASLGHLRERVEDLGAEVGGPHRLGLPLAVVARSDRRDAHAAETRTRKLLASVGSPAALLGVVPDDVSGVDALYSGALTRRVSRSNLFAAGRDITNRLLATWPELTDSVPSNDFMADAVSGARGIRS